MAPRSYVQNNNLLWRIRNSQIKHSLLVMLDGGVSHERLKPPQETFHHFTDPVTPISLQTTRVRAHTHLPFTTVFPRAIEVWFLCSLFFCCPQFIPFPFFLLYSADPPWIWAPTPDERHFISELLTQFHRVCFLFEGEIKKEILFTAFFFSSSFFK